MKRFLSAVLVLVLMLSLSAAAFADSHSHVFGQWRTFRSATETLTGIDRRYCSCGAYEEMETPVLPKIYISNTRDSEQLRAVTVTGAIVGDDAGLSDWICSQMVDQLELLTDRHFHQIIHIKYEGLGLGSFVQDAEHEVSLSAEQFERLMEARDNLCLQLSTARASVILDEEATAALKPEKSIALRTELSGSKLSVELLVDGKAVDADMSVLCWTNEEGKYMGTEDAELVWGVDCGKKYAMAYCDGAEGIELRELDEEPAGWGLLRFNGLWKLRLGEQFVY